MLFILFLIRFRYNYIFMYIRYFWGCDLLSFVIILLRIWICCLIIMARGKIYVTNYYPGLFIFVMLMLMISLVFTFASINLFIFYLFFEISLIPTLILILGWGYQPERLQAGVYLLFYTLFASLPMMLSIFYYYDLSGSLDYFYIDNLVSSLYMYICINIVFFIKMPIYFVHL